MHLSLSPLWLVLPSFALSLSLPVPPETRGILPIGKDVKQDVINIHNAVLKLDASIESYKSSPLPLSLLGGTPTLLGVVGVHTVNRAGYLHATIANPFTLQDSTDIIDTVISTVNISIPAATKHMIEKTADFKASGLTQIVVASLKVLLYDHDSFSDAVLAKVDTGIPGQTEIDGRAAVANIHNVIQEAIDYISNN